MSSFHSIACHLHNSQRHSLIVYSSAEEEIINNIDIGAVTSHDYVTVVEEVPIDI